MFHLVSSNTGEGIEELFKDIGFKYIEQINQKKINNIQQRQNKSLLFSLKKDLNF